ncbi:MAG TPA: hypothetical protein VKX17_07925 [Planctomycetota bacterium]|nr:hypothetical protein [Planctomycetota bacterium]
MSNAAHKRRWLQIHLSTAVIVSLAAGGLLGLNLRYERTSFYSDEGQIVQEITRDQFIMLCLGIAMSPSRVPRDYVYRVRRIGWPMLAYSSRTDERGWGTIDHGAAAPVIDLSGDKDFRGTETGINAFGISINAAVAFAIILSTAIFCEWRIRRKRARHETLKP